MSLLHLLAIAAALFLAAVMFAVWSYGRFAKRSAGAPSHAIAPPDNPCTELDLAVAGLAEEHDGATGLAMVAGNLDAFAVRALSAREAGRSLDLMYYYWKDDLTGRLLAREVIAAADRGVHVRLLLDDINASGKDRAYQSLDAHPNIAVRLFNPSRARDPGLRRGIEMVLRAFRVNRRMHNKAWIADGRLAIVGGRNIGDAYFGASDGSNFRDVDVALIGPAVAEAVSVFDAFWNSELTMPIRALARLRKARLGRIRKSLRKLAASEAARRCVEAMAERPSLTDLLRDQLGIDWTQSVKVLSDPPDKAVGLGESRWLARTIRSVIASADSRLSITSPYFIPGPEGVSGLTALVAAGADVAVLTNSLAATDVAAVHGGYAPYRKALLEAGVRLFELQPYRRGKEMSLLGSRGASLHTKSFTVDHHTGFVGSFNFDPRSMSLNTEMGVLFVQPDLVARLTALFERETRPDFSYELALAENGALSWREEDRGRTVVHRHEPEASRTRRAVAAIVTWLPIQSQL